MNVAATAFVECSVADHIACIDLTTLSLQGRISIH